MSSQTRQKFAEILNSFCKFKDFVSYNSLIIQHPCSQASVGCIWEFRQTPFLILLWKIRHNLIKREVLQQLFAGWALCPPSELGQKQPVREDVPYHAHRELGDRYDKIKFSHLGRNKGSFGRDSALTTYRKIMSSS